MRYYLVATTKFVNECLRNLTYGATQSNWLANIEIGDIVFISQFNYKSQNIFGPFKVIKKLFYDKTVIYPEQKFYYRIQFKPIGKIKCIEETDLFLYGINTENVTSYFRLITLIQQNKHLHCISLTDHEGRAFLDTFEHFGKIVIENYQPSKINTYQKVDSQFIYNKNKLNKKLYFSSESDLESYLIFSLKNSDNQIYKIIEKLLNKHQSNILNKSEIYNQFIFGNAYPSDITIINKGNINIFELKKDELIKNTLPQLEKEIRKHLYYSLFSDRIKNTKTIRQFHFYILCLKNSNNTKMMLEIQRVYKNLLSKIAISRKNTIDLLEYSNKEGKIFIE